MMMKIPGPQSNYDLALETAFAAAAGMSAAGRTRLGARDLDDGRCELKVLDDTFTVDLKKKTIMNTRGEDVKLDWKILSLHYMTASYPWPEFKRWMSFGEIAELRGYKPVFDNRVIGRLCATAGRDRETFSKAGMALQAGPLEWGDVGFLFQVFPMLAVGIAWYAGDEELPPGVSFIYPDNVMAFLPLEDVVVLAEAVVARLQKAA